jgi:Outer membrane protein transport protein (OMPP1/FadL/TodX)
MRAVLAVGWPGAAALRGSIAVAAALCLCCSAGAVHAQSLSVEPSTARGVARAGVGLVADDVAAVWWQNPAAAARRASARVVLGVVIVDPDLEIEPLAVTSAPLAVSRASSGYAGAAALSFSLGRFTVGGSYLSAQRLARRFEGAVGGIPTDVGQRVFPLRYAGLSGVLRRDQLSVGAAYRVTDGLALGLSISAGRVVLTESRRLWAGLAGRDEVGSPLNDLELTLEAHDPVAPAASLGVVLAPEDAPIELAASISAVASGRLAGGLAGRTPDENGPRLRAAGEAALSMPAALVMRSGVRWQGARWSVEGDGHLELIPTHGRALTWKLAGVEIVDPQGLVARPDQLSSQLSLRSLASLRAAADVEVIDGLLWLTGGVAWSPIATSSMRVAPAFAELGGTTAAVGAEVSAAGVTVVVGLSRSWSRSLTVTRSLRGLDNPFDAGDHSTGFGVYRSAVDQVGISVEVEGR